MKKLFVFGFLFGLVAGCGADFDDPEVEAEAVQSFDTQDVLTCRAALPPFPIVRGCLSDAGCPAGGACYSYACIAGKCVPALDDVGSECVACGQTLACNAIGACSTP
jgi:hypothetical protein